jgi:hypothetical protein
MIRYFHTNRIVRYKLLATKQTFDDALYLESSERFRQHIYRERKHQIISTTSGFCFVKVRFSIQHFRQSDFSPKTKTKKDNSVGTSIVLSSISYE